MITADDVRRVGLALPRAYERLVGGRWKLRVRQYVFVAFSRDETAMGFGFPREERDGLVDSDPETFFLPRASDLRYHWVCAHLDRLGHEEMRELVVDAWRLCVPRMLHDLPDLPAPTAAAWSAVEEQDWETLRDLLHPEVQWTDRGLSVQGRETLLGRLAVLPAPRPPTRVEVVQGRILRWAR